MAVGCSHGGLADPKALDAVLRFRDKWKPDCVIHLGDAFDTTAFRSGAKGTSDESEPVRPDLDAGIQFLKSYRPNVLTCGNHEDRLWNLRSHPSAIVSELAMSIVTEIQTECERMKCKLIPYHFKQFHQLGDTKFFHGTLFNEMCCRDHAEAYGNCVFAHAHRPGMAYGRRFDSPLGVCVGTLLDPARANYAKSRRATLGWGQGFAWGEYCDTRTVTWLHVQPQNQTEWVLPI